MKKIYLFIIILIFTLSGTAQNNLDPSQILNKAVTVITQTKGVEAKFNLNNNSFSGKGVIKTSGTKYNVSLPDVEIWYNGKELYTLNHNSGETTLINPTEEEISESNPLAYVTNANLNYNVSFSTVKKPDKYVLELLPKKTKGDVKRVTLTIKKNNFYVEKIVIEPKSGSPVSAEITSFKTGASLPSSTFEYPKTKYPAIEIIDLR